MAEPTTVSRIAIPKQDGTVEYWELTDAWRLMRTDPAIDSLVSDAELEAHAENTDAHHPQAHTHPTLGDINFIGTVSADGDAGLTGQRTVGGYKFTFTKGLLTGFEAV